MMPIHAHQSRRIERIVIVGGGSAGWMAAIYLNRYMRRMNGKVVLVESPTVGTIGVGEATIPSIVHFVRQLNLDEKEFMRRCSATFKLAIKFDGWRGIESSYWHSFGVCGSRIDGLDLLHFWLKRRLEAGSKLTYSDYSLQARLSEENKAPWPSGGTSRIAEAGAYAYHVDAAAMGDYFKEIATGEGVQHLFGHVQNVALDEQGNIASLDIGGERAIAGDLFVDATGFSGRLIEKTLGDSWIDWSRFMLNDSAVAMSVPRDDRFPPYTHAQAMPAGWIWRIPLSSRIGTGYVHSSAHISADEATAALIARSGLRKERSADPRLIKIRVGRRSNFWLRNCVSVGLASGFIEPLESTGLHLALKAVTLLVNYLPDRDFSDALRRAYNARMAEVYDEIRDFIVLHYITAQRDEPFWRDARNVPIPDTLRETLAAYDETGRIDSARLQLFPETSYYFILAGNGRYPKRPVVQADVASPGEIWQILDRIRAENREYAARMPSHNAYLADLHRTSF